jgi:hypothetical protein
MAKAKLLTTKEAYNIDSVDDLTIEMEATQSGGLISDMLFTLYGPPKIGKSNLASLFENVYCIATEPGYKFLTVRKTYISGWESFKKFIRKLKKSPKALATIDCFSIDTIDNLSKFCQLYVCGKGGFEHPADLDWGKGWDAFKTEFFYWIMELLSLQKGVVFIGHEQTKTVEVNGMDVERTQPCLPNTTYNIINGLCDCILHMGFDRTLLKKHRKDTKKNSSLKYELCRCVRTKPTDTLDAGDRTALLPAKINFKTETELYNKLLDYLEGEEE